MNAIGVQSYEMASIAGIFWNFSLFLCPFPGCTALPTKFIDICLEHLRNEHQVVIHQVPQVISFLDEYIYKMFKMRSANLREKKVELHNSVEYEVWNEQQLREKLKQDTLVHVISTQTHQCKNLPPRPCLFCRHGPFEITDLFFHLETEHGMYLGDRMNMVNLDLFFNMLSEKLALNQCIYCERNFDTGAILRKHMRKLKHFQVNPRNEAYDRFYVVNYANHLRKEPLVGDENSVADEYGLIFKVSWSDWSEYEMPTQCLFDETMHSSAEECHVHMITDHGFNLNAQVSNFYQQTALINFIRSKSSNMLCFVCDAEFESLKDLSLHLETLGHLLEVPGNDHPMWSDPFNMFPCFENDPLLTLDHIELSQDGKRHDYQQ